MSFLKKVWKKSFQGPVLFVLAVTLLAVIAGIFN